MARIDTPSGPILALHDNDLVYARGIEYGTAKRFQKPVANTWTEVKDCTKKTTICPQHQFRFEFVLGPMPLDRPMGEDCLRLSVIAPQNAKNLPVVVWIHGGANISGGADIDLMDTSEIAKLGFVTVAIQYRLGLYGCVEIPGLAEANLCVYDQMMALQWVKDNISAFGGNAQETTIMGQSAGGWGVYNMLLAPTDGLFNKAIIISGPLELKPKGDLGAIIKPKLTDDNILDLQAEMLKLRDGSIDDFTADRRKAPFPADLNQRLLDRKDVELLVGWAADDCYPFIRLIPAGRMISNLPLIGSTLEQVASKVATYTIFKRGAVNLAAQHNKNGGKATTFEFQWYPKGNPFKACHCIEMPFMFGGWAQWASAPLLVGNESEEVVTRLAPTFKNMLVTFMKQGLEKGKHIEINERFTEKSYL